MVLAAESVVWQPELFLAIDVDGGRPGERREAMVRAASAIERAWLEEDYPEHVHELKDLFYDAEREKVRATLTTAICRSRTRARPPCPTTRAAPCSRRWRARRRAR